MGTTQHRRFLPELRDAQPNEAETTRRSRIAHASPASPMGGGVRHSPTRASRFFVRGGYGLPGGGAVRFLSCPSQLLHDVGGTDR